MGPFVHEDRRERFGAEVGDRAPADHDAGPQAGQAVPRPGLCPGRGQHIEQPADLAVPSPGGGGESRAVGRSPLGLRSLRSGFARLVWSCAVNAPDDALSERECWELLATASVGRLALSVRALPVILPVQYYLDGRRLAVCLGHQALPERAVDETIIAFAADSIDPVTRSGWSVQVQGQSVIPRGLRIETACGWPSSPAQVVEIEPRTISGRRVHLCSFIDTLLAAGSTQQAT